MNHIKYKEMKRNKILLEFFPNLIEENKNEKPTYNGTNKERT